MSFHVTTRKTNAEPNTENLAKMKEVKKDPQQAYDLEQEQYIQDKKIMVERAQGNHKARLAWFSANEVNEKKKPKCSHIRASYSEERMPCWKKHFQNLLR